MPNQCRICFESWGRTELFSPCKCAGTSKYVHRHCLNQWRLSSNNVTALKRCMICKAEYKIKKKSVFERLQLYIVQEAMLLFIINFIIVLWCSPEVYFGNCTKYYRYHVYCAVA